MRAAMERQARANGQAEYEFGGSRYAIQADPAPPTSAAVPLLASVDRLLQELSEGTSLSAVKTFLSRHAIDNPGCREPIAAPRKGEPRFLYRTQIVLPLLVNRYGHR